jgi:hypothetical protein
MCYGLNTIGTSQEQIGDGILQGLMLLFSQKKGLMLLAIVVHNNILVDLLIYKSNAELINTAQSFPNLVIILK